MVMEQEHPCTNFYLGFDSIWDLIWDLMRPIYQLGKCNINIIQLSTNQFLRVNGKQSVSVVGLTCLSGSG